MEDIKVVYSNNKLDWHNELNNDDEYGAVVANGWQAPWDYLSDYHDLLERAKIVFSDVKLTRINVYSFVIRNTYKRINRLVATDYLFKKLQSEVNNEQT